jgi:hypothetical protein
LTSWTAKTALPTCSPPTRPVTPLVRTPVFVGDFSGCRKKYLKIVAEGAVKGMPKLTQKKSRRISDPQLQTVSQEASASSTNYTGFLQIFITF